MTGPLALPTPGTPDLFHRYLDRRMRSARGLGNGSQFVFELDGELEPGLLRARLDLVTASLPVLCAGLPDWPGRRWTAVPDHVVPVRVETLDCSVDSWFSRRFGDAFVSPDRPSLELVVGRGEGACPLSSSSTKASTSSSPSPDGESPAELTRVTTQ